MLRSGLVVLQLLIGVMIVVLERAGFHHDKVAIFVMQLVIRSWMQLGLELGADHEPTRARKAL